MNLIYQFWVGSPPKYAHISKQLMKLYADLIGADYICDFNSGDSRIPSSDYFNCFRPIYDKSLDKYDKILFCDMDIFPVLGITESIFDEPLIHFGIAEEEHQPELRYNLSGQICGTNDEAWGAIVEKNYPQHKLLRDDKNRLRVFNSGVVLYTRSGIELAREKWADFAQYQSLMRSLNRFYQLDQNYLNAMLAGNKFTIMDTKWNSQIYYYPEKEKIPANILDTRTANTNFVHIQLRPRDILTEDMVYDITNIPIQEWRHVKV